MPKFLILCLFLILSVSLQAATFCVGTSSELMDALETTESNGQDNVIQIKNGDYLTDGVSAFSYLAEDNQNLTLSGGWLDFGAIECMSQIIDPLGTVLDGNNQTSVLNLSHQQGKPNVNITVENLTISNGFSDSLSAPGMTTYFQPGHMGRLSINWVMFVGNTTNTAAISALYNYNSYFTNISNSVFFLNHSKDGFGTVYITQTPDAEGVYFVNNTLINNTDNQTSPPNPFISTGLFINLSGDMNGAPQGLMVNNLFWNNDHNDITALGEGAFYLYNNNYQNREGVFAIDEGNISEPPLLAAQPLDFTPQPGSPLINAGKSQPMLLRGFNFFLQSWSYGNLDFDGGILGRVVDGRVDIGAVEALPEIPIFEDGFEG